MKTKSRELIEIVGIFSVVVSLVFVGVQLLLDRRVAIGAQFHARSALYHQAEQSLFENDAYVHDWAQVRESGRLPGWWDKEIEDFQEFWGLSHEAMHREETVIRMRLIRFNDNFFQYERGLITEETLQMQLIGLRNNIRSPYFRTIAQNFNVLEQSFKNLIDELIIEL